MLSVIIPTLNEARRIGARLEDLKAADIAAEIIVADGGS
ncbi:MAG: glycosyl transferase family 2, partial [Rhodospirillaceae bacterium]|nr:glycosyl transferase family 2 [Rhodospirillaceae bacterium]